MPKPPYTPGARVRGRGRVGRRRGRRRRASATRVLVDGFLAGPRSLGAYQAYGGFASYAVAPPRRCTAIPGALLVRSGVQPARQLRDRVSLPGHARPARRPARRCSIHGASGSTGLAAVHVAKLLGATVIATGRSDDEARGGEGAGRRPRRSTGRGDGVRLPRRGEGAHRRARRRRRLRRRRRRHLAREPALREVRRALPHRRLGRDAVRRAGQGPARRAEREPAPDEPDHDEGPRRARLPDRDLDGERSVDPRRRASRRCSRGPRAGKIRPHVSHAFPLAEFKAAMRAKWNGEVVGGCVVHP